MNSFTDKLRKTAADLAETTKAAGLLAAAEARKVKLKSITLPAAYLALGRDIFGGGRFRSEFPEIYAEIESVQAEIARLTTGHDPTTDGTFAGKAKQTASKMKDTAQAKASGLKLDAAMRRLGEACYAVHREESGSEEILQPIAECLTGIERAQAVVQEQAERSRGRAITLKMLLIGGIGALATVVLGAVYFLSQPQLPAVDSPEVVDLVKHRMQSDSGFKMIEGLSGRKLTSLTIENPVEVEYDSTVPKRTAKAKMSMAFGGEMSEGDVYYTVEWLNNNRKSIWVEIEHDRK